MRSQSVVSAFVICMLTVSSSTLEASFLGNNEEQVQERGTARKRTVREVYSQPSVGDRLYGVGQSLYSVGSALGSLGWSLGALGYTGVRSFGAFVNSRIAASSEPERTQFRATVSRPQIAGYVQQDLEAQAARKTPPLANLGNSFVDILPNHVLDYVGKHRDIVIVGNSKYRIHFEMCNQNGEIHDRGELGSLIKVNLLKFSKIKETPHSIHYVAVGRDQRETNFAYNRAHPDVRMYLTFRKEAAQISAVSDNSMNHGHQRVTEAPFERPAKRQRGTSYVPPVSHDRTTRSTRRPESSRQPRVVPQAIDLTNDPFNFGLDRTNSSTASSGSDVRRNARRAPQMQRIVVDLADTQTPVVPARNHAIVLNLEEEESEGFPYSDVSMAEEAEGKSPDLIVSNLHHQNARNNGVILDLEDPVSLNRALNQYNPERQRNGIQEIYVTWFQEMNRSSGLKEACAWEKYYEEREPHNIAAIRQAKSNIEKARLNLKRLAAQQPIYLQLRHKGFTDFEIKDAQQKLWLNFYDN